MSDNKELSLYTKKLKPSEILKLCPSLIKFPTLTNRQRAFVYYYCKNGQNKLDAAIKAGYKTSKRGKKKRQYMFIQANQNLYKPNVQEAIKQVLNDQIGLRKTALEHNIFETLIKVIELDICDYLDDQGNVKSKLSDIPKVIRQMIKKTEVKYYGKDAQVKVLSLEFLGKEWAMEKLMKYINMIKEGDTNVNIMASEVKMNLLNMLKGGEESGE